MSAKLPRPVQNLIDSFTKLPGIGPKMAGRLTFYLLQKSEYELNLFIDALDSVKKGLHPCKQCGHITDQELCNVCDDLGRDQKKICIVEGSLDVIALEKTGVYNGLYHVLGGALSPIDGIGPDQLRLSLLERRVASFLEDQDGLELIVATNPSLEGEATAQYISQIFQNYHAEKLNISRIARGLPMGSDLEYADPTTLTRALEGRKNIINNI